ncbi:hypothetical protein [Oceanobacillus sp. J11TS1]|uniref:hypothetical protein n=1 Tax=Oceanobacillus sp. J11TS1 TaxID=2807191 RepID=UPI001B2C0CAD|nr:hypothetical protein [Oceanobacillus sp. J11TS1]GIO22267.1 hypothetical protein J11TS1_08480 [Oceanobacillus sp. J11TS1]
MALDEIIFRRLKKLPPLDCTIVPGSTPVIAFGRFRSAKVATISLNPSYREFHIVKGKRRFHNLKSLGLSRYEDINEYHMHQVLDYCERYFKRPGIVYKEWFNSISSFLRGCTDYDYYDGTACHLDLSQWATLNILGKLNTKQKKAFTSTGDLELLAGIIKHTQINILFHILFLKWSNNIKRDSKIFWDKA